MERVARAVVLVVPLIVLALAVHVGAQGGNFVISRPTPDIAVYGPPEVEVEPGEAREYALRVENRANFTERLRFGATLSGAGSPGDGLPLAMRISPSSAALPPNATVDLTLYLYAFPDAEPANLSLTIEIMGASGLPLASAPIAARVAAPPSDPALPEGAWLALGAMAAAGALAWLAWRTEWLRYAALVALAPLYTRLAPSRLLEQERREALFKLIEQEPGIHFSALLERTGLPNGVVVHHVRTLERHGLVKSRREGSLRRFATAVVPFPPPLERPITPMQERVLVLLAESPRTQGEIAEALGLTQQGANRHVKALERRGLLQIRYADGAWRCHAAAPLASAAE